MLAQFVDGRMVVTADLVRQRQIGGIEDARLSAKQRLVGAKTNGGRAWMKAGSSDGKVSGSVSGRKRDMSELRRSGQRQAKS